MYWFLMVIFIGLSVADICDQPKGTFDRPTVSCLSLFHVHSNSRNPEPSKRDWASQPDLQIPMYTMSSQGLKLIESRKEKHTQIPRRGTFWLDLCP